MLSEPVVEGSEPGASMLTIAGYTAVPTEDAPVERVPTQTAAPVVPTQFLPPAGSISMVSMHAAENPVVTAAPAATSAPQQAGQDSGAGQDGSQAGQGDGGQTSQDGQQTTQQPPAVDTEKAARLAALRKEADGYGIKYNDRNTEKWLQDQIDRAKADAASGAGEAAGGTSSTTVF